MFIIAKNPYSEPIKKFLSELKSNEWKFPYILQFIHGLISIFLLLILSLLYVTVGFISQISNTFWDVIDGLGQKMSFSNPFPSLFYAISAAVYFIIFLPFFMIQSPIWFSGWLTSKIGFKPFVIILFTVVITMGIYYFQPQFAMDALDKVNSFQDSIRQEYFTSDSLSTIDSTTAQMKNIVEKN